MCSWSHIITHICLGLCETEYASSLSEVKGEDRNRTKLGQQPTLTKQLEPGPLLARLRGAEIRIIGFKRNLCWGKAGALGYWIVHWFGGVFFFKSKWLSHTFHAVLLRDEETADENQVSVASEDSGVCKPCHTVLAAAPWQPSMLSLFSPAMLSALEHGEDAPEQPPQTSGGWVSAPPGEFPALWFHQLSCCLVCLDEKSGK